MNFKDYLNQELGKEGTKKRKVNDEKLEKVRLAMVKKEQKFRKDGKPKKSGCAKGENRGQGRKQIAKEDKAIPMSVSIKGAEEKRLFEEFKLKLKR